MGIPAYFSYIIKNHSNIITNFKKLNVTFSSLFMDCNSIIYDAYYSILKECDQNIEFDVFINIIIDNVISSIENYVNIINPTKIVYIGFDGVAPFAKMDQQRNRRYKTDFMSKIFINDNTKPQHKFTTSMITPGTYFMNILSQRILFHFSNTPRFIVSTSDDPGEGEHKIFQYMREHYSSDETIAVYGLDSDLIMLSLFHFNLFENIFIFREAPEFMKSSIPVDIVPSNTKEPYFINIKLLSSSIIHEMNCKFKNNNQIYDYIFLCFFIGNDFLPHFPAINIRTNGIQILLDVYRKHIGNYNDRSIIKDNQINWRWVSTIISELAKNEHELILQDYTYRDKFDNWNWTESTQEEKEKLINNIPVIYRNLEKYIHPKEHFWEERYYKSLFHLNRDDNNVRNICNNYMEGLEWVYKYYTIGCPDWHWKYNYHYAPLLCDLQKYIPHFFMDFIIDNKHLPFLPQVQLAYVLPSDQLNLLSKQHHHYLITKYKHLYNDKIDFIWAFKRYFYECHCILPNISIELLNKWNDDFAKI